MQLEPLMTEVTYSQLIDKDIEVWEEQDMIRFLGIVKDESAILSTIWVIFWYAKKGRFLDWKWQDLSYKNNKIWIM